MSPPTAALEAVAVDAITSSELTPGENGKCGVDGYLLLGGLEVEAPAVDAGSNAGKVPAKAPSTLPSCCRPFPGLLLLPPEARGAIVLGAEVNCGFWRCRRSSPFVLRPDGPVGDAEALPDRCCVYVGACTFVPALIPIGTPVPFCNVNLRLRSRTDADTLGLNRGGSYVERDPNNVTAGTCQYVILMFVQTLCTLSTYRDYGGTHLLDGTESSRRTFWLPGLLAAHTFASILCAGFTEAALAAATAAPTVALPTRSNRLNIVQRVPTLSF